MNKLVFVLLCAAVACTPDPSTVNVGELPGISQPHSLHVVGDDLIFLDGHAAYVYSLNPLQLKHSFGGEGDGSFQFQYWPRLGLDGETIYGLDFLKTSWFSLRGEPLRTIPYTDFDDFDPAMEMVLEPAGENYVRTTVDHESNRRFVQLFDRDLQLIDTLYQGLFDWRGALPAFRVDVTGDDEHIVVSDSEKGFYILVFDTHGHLLCTIDKSAVMETTPFTDADQEAYLESVRRNEPPEVFERLSRDPRFKEHFPKLNHVDIDDGKLYVITERRQGEKREIVILDLEGQVLRTVFVPLKSKNLSRRILRFDPYVVHEGRLYEIVRNDSTATFEVFVTVLN